MGRRPSLAIHVPISPTPLFLNRLHYLAASLRENGGPYARTPIVATVGEDCEPFDVAAGAGWARRYGVTFRWVPRPLFRDHRYFATRLQRFRWPHDADVILLLDADVLVVAPFDDMIERCAGEQRLLGVPANISPLRHDLSWERLFALAGLGEVPYAVEHTGFGCLYEDEARRYAPPYFNGGVVAVPRPSATAIGGVVLDELRTVQSVEHTYCGQMSTTLAICRLGIAWGVNPFRYNFVNNDAYLRRWSAELDDVRLLHYLDRSAVDKEEDFASPATIAALLAREAAGVVDRRLVAALRPVHARVLADLRSPWWRRKRKRPSEEGL